MKNTLTSDTNTISLSLKIFLILSAVFYILMLFSTAWITEDAFITFRSVKNFIDGNGLTWNIGERVQAFTHPLWFFILSAFYFFTREIYFTTLIISVLISLAVVYLLFRNSVTLITASFLILLLSLSKAFIDYSTSGLENPLSSLLIIVFFIAFTMEGEDKRKVFYLFLTGSLILLCRMDLILLIIPALAYSLIKNIKYILPALAGLIPFLIWEIFSLFYFGYLFPNTAYAKLNTGIPSSELAAQGLYYFYHSLKLDPITIILIFAGILYSYTKKNIRFFIWAAGISIYILYIVKIGGDFHSGRFLSPVFMAAILPLTKFEMKPDYGFAALLLLLIGIHLLSPFPFYDNTPNYGTGSSIFKPFYLKNASVRINDNGIADERSSLFRYTGLVNNLSERKLETHAWVISGINIRAEEKVIVRNNIGLFGYNIDPRIYLVDPYALTDPLLSRLPSTEYWRIGHKWNGKEKFWRIGHFARKIPEGYLETLRSGNMEIKDSSLSEYYRIIKIITRDSLFSTSRLKEIVLMNTGYYDHLLIGYLNSGKTGKPKSITFLYLLI